MGLFLFLSAGHLLCVSHWERDRGKTGPSEACRAPHAPPGGREPGRGRCGHHGQLPAARPGRRGQTGPSPGLGGVLGTQCAGGATSADPKDNVCISKQFLRLATRPPHTHGDPHPPPTHRDSSGALKIASDPHPPSASGRVTGHLFPVDAQAVLVSSARPREGPELDRKEPTQPPVPEEGGMGQSLLCPQTEGGKERATRDSRPSQCARPARPTPAPASPCGFRVVRAVLVQRQRLCVLGGSKGGWSSLQAWGSPRCLPRVGTQ